MESTDQIKTTCKSIDSTSPYYLHPACNTNLVLSPVVLRGDNYGEWARSVRNAFKANNKMGFLDGTISKPSETASDISLWVQVNSMLTAWLQNTIDASIRSTVPLTDNVKDMWDDLQQRFSIGNGPRINELGRQIYSCSQNNDSMVIYYGRLRKLWEEIQGMIPPLFVHTAINPVMIKTTVLNLSDTRNGQPEDVLMHNPTVALVVEGIQEYQREAMSYKKVYSIILAVDCQIFSLS